MAAVRKKVEFNLEGMTLAKDVYDAAEKFVAAKGTVLNKSYIKRLIYLGISQIYIVADENSVVKAENVDDINEIVLKEKTLESVSKILLKFSYSNDAEISKIVIEAETVVNEILNEPKIMYNVAKIRRNEEKTYMHSINVSALATMVGIRMKLSKIRLRDLAIGGLMHDIGLELIPYNLRNAYFEKCNAIQRKEIMKHVLYGYELLQKESWMSDISRDIILNHHERFDGTGYMCHLANDKLRLETKIVAVCDEFDNNVYGNMCERQKVYKVIERLKSLSNIKFDKQVVDNFILSVAAYPVGEIVILNTNERGIVIRQNKDKPNEPVIKIIKSNASSEKNEDITIDLSMDLKRKIVDTEE